LVIVIFMAAIPLAMVVGLKRSSQPTAGSHSSVSPGAVSRPAGPLARPRPEEDRQVALRAAADGRLAEAARLLAQVVSRAPGDAEALNALGVTLVRQGDLSGGTRALARAVAADPGLAEAHLNLAVTLDRQGRGGQAARHYRAFLDRAGTTHPWRDPARQRLAELDPPGRGR
jgi:thioredoxin-like negative regulator of GroEL